MALMMCLIMAGALAACSGSKGKTYKVGTEPTYPPFDTTNEDGDIIGFDMDLMKAIAKDQGFEVEFASFDFDALIPALKSDSADIVIAGMNITPERAKQVDFSDSYYKTGVVLLVKKNSTKITGWDSFTSGSGLKVAAQTLSLIHIFFTGCRFEHKYSDLHYISLLGRFSFMNNLETVSGLVYLDMLK